MSKLVEDVKSGIKGIRGAGDVIRGEAMDKTDQLLDTNRKDPSVEASESKNRAIADKGRSDIRQMDSEIGSREWARKKRVDGEASALGENGATATHHTTADEDARLAEATRYA